jgi:hypothetical protein
MPKPSRFPKPAPANSGYLIETTSSSPNFVGSHDPADAKFIAENAGNKIAAATWLCKIMTAGQNRHTKTRNRP